MEIILGIALLVGIFVFANWIYYEVGGTIQKHVKFSDNDEPPYVGSKQCTGCGSELRGYEHYTYPDHKEVIYDTCGTCQTAAIAQQQTNRLLTYACISCRMITKADYCPHCGRKCYPYGTCTKCGKSASTPYCDKCGSRIATF